MISFSGPLATRLPDVQWSRPPITLLVCFFFFFSKSHTSLWVGQICPTGTTCISNLFRGYCPLIDTLGSEVCDLPGSQDYLPAGPLGP